MFNLYFFNNKKCKFTCWQEFKMNSNWHRSVFLHITNNHPQTNVFQFSFISTTFTATPPPPPRYFFKTLSVRADINSDNK